MVDTVGFRFRPTDEEIVDHYLRHKNIDSDTSRVDGVISTIKICSFDPWDLPSQSRIESRDQVWYFLGRKENKYNRGERQSRKTKSGFWKKTGVTMNILRKKGKREKIGEKRILVFHLSKNSKSNWVMHEYYSTCLSPNQKMTYTICKVEFKGEERHISSPVTPMNNIGGLRTGAKEGQSQELENQLQLTGFIDELQETRRKDAIKRFFDNPSSYDWKSLLDVVDGVDGEQSNIVFMQEDCSDSDIYNKSKQNLIMCLDQEQKSCFLFTG